MRTISVFRDAWAMGRRDSGIPGYLNLNDNQRARDLSRCNFPQTPRRCQIDTKRFAAPPQYSNIHRIYSSTNSRSSHSLATQVDRDDRPSSLSPTGFYSTYRVTDARAKLYTAPGVSNAQLCECREKKIREKRASARVPGALTRSRKIESIIFLAGVWNLSSKIYP